MPLDTEGVMHIVTGRLTPWNGYAAPPGTAAGGSYRDGGNRDQGTGYRGQGREIRPPVPYPLYPVTSPGSRADRPVALLHLGVQVLGRQRTVDVREQGEV